MIKKSEIPNGSKIQIGNKICYTDSPNNNFNNEDQIDFSQFFETDDLSKMIKDTPISTDDENININNKQKKQYNIIPMFWLFKTYQKDFQSDDKDLISLNDNLLNNCDVVNISYNINFGNLRLSFYDFPNDNVKNYVETDKVLFFNHLKSITNITIYPTDCFKLLNFTNQTFQFIEPLFYNGEPWQVERPIIHVEKLYKNNQLKMSIWTNESLGYSQITEYVFNDVNYELLKHSCKFVIDGGFLSSSNYSITK